MQDHPHPEVVDVLENDGSHYRPAPSKPDEHRVMARLRKYLLAGLVVVGPVCITLYLAWKFITLVDGWVKPYVPSAYNPDSYLPFPVPGVGLVFAVLLLTIIGALAANLLSKVSELMLGRTPIVRNVYQGLKQIFESVATATSPKQAFQKVAMMEFPSKGIWSIVFITGEASQEISREIKRQVPGHDLVSVFMPTGMLPPSGFVCFVPRESVIPIRMSVEDAAKIIISAGMVNPETQAKLRDIAARSGTRTPLAGPPPEA
ncbi:MAG TPA: DUF502 domain-containing protein [Hyphomicrobiaceae bacterium]|nr:DUF502 domain-containing protein [Hyphomicrobiaceae bacterium]